VTASFGATSNGSSVLTLTAGNSATTGPATVTITGTSGTLIATTSIVLTVNAAPAGQTTCVPISDISLDNNQYIYQNNEWNSTLEQCATANGAGFTLTTADFNQTALGPPASYTPATYPSIFWGCHWGTCTTGSTLPIQESQLATASSSVSTVMPAGYNNDVAYDIWFNQTPTATGQPNGTEIMIWINHQGAAAPFGTNIGTVTLDGATWQVWTGNQTSWNIVSYVQVPGTTAVSLDLMPFFNDATTRKTPAGTQVLEPSWYLLDIEFGFEVWDGGQGLSVNNFTASATATTQTKPSITSLSPTSGVDGSSVTITGTNFGASQGSSTVSFGGVNAAITSWSKTSIKATVPSLAVGAANVTVNVGRVSSNAAAFTVTQAGSFSLSPSAATLSIAQGASAAGTITITDQGSFTAPVTLTASGLPAGVTAAFKTNPTTASSALTFTVGASTVAGSYPITITGTSGSLTAKTSITLTVTNSTGGYACHVAYAITSQWSSGFGASLNIENTGSTPISNWTLTWTFANGQTITQLWNGNETQSGANVTVTNMSYNGSIPAGGSISSVGFNGTWNNATNAVPASFAVNGTICK
jgi:hypothetical protein